MLNKLKISMVDVSLEDPRIHKVGFARLVGTPGVDHIVNKYEIVLGRRNKNKAIDVSLGDTMSVSRQHARIYYDFSNKGFYLLVLGKNGVSVNGTSVSPGDAPVLLESQSLLEVGNDVAVHFLLPKKLNKVFTRKSQSLKRKDKEQEHVQDSKRLKSSEPTVATDSSSRSVANALLNALKGGLAPS